MISNAALFYAGTAVAIFQLNLTNQMSKKTQCIEIGCLLLYTILHV